MSENKVQIILEAVDRTKEAFNQLKTNSEGVLSSLKSNWLAFTAAGTAIYGVISSLKTFVNEAAEAEQIEKRMAFQMEAAGYQFKTIKPLIDEFANSVQNATRFSAEMAREGLGQMMQYTNDLNKALQGTRLAMDATTQTGIPLQTTIKWMGFAMEGEVEILGRMNPAFKDLGSSLGENATKAEKSAYAMEFFNKKFGGASLADVKTYAGQVSHLKNQWSDFKEMVGNELLPTVIKATQALAGMVKAGILWMGGGPEKDRLKRDLAETEEVISRIEKKRSDSGKIPVFHRVEYEQKLQKRIDLTAKLSELQGRIDAAKGTKSTIAESAPINKEAADALLKAREAIAEENYKMSNFYQFEENVMKGKLTLLESEKTLREQILSIQQKIAGIQESAIDIMERLEIGAKSSLERWTKRDILGEFGTILGSGEASEEEINRAREKYIAAVEVAKGTGWGEKRETATMLDETISKLKTMTAKETEVGKLTVTLGGLQAALTNLTQAFTVGETEIKINDTQIRSAITQFDTLKRKLDDLSGMDVPITISIKGIEQIEAKLADRWGNGRSGLRGAIEGE